jgi:hypothetical protein
MADGLTAELVERLAGGLPNPLDSEFVDAIARRVLELAAESRASEVSRRPQLLTVADVAARLRVGPKWVYAHQRELGAIRLGDGPKARLRFDAQVIEARLEQRDDTAATAVNQATKPQARSTSRPRRRHLISRPLPPTNRSHPRA